MADVKACAMFSTTLVKMSKGGWDGTLDMPIDNTFVADALEKVAQHFSSFQAAALVPSSNILWSLSQIKSEDAELFSRIVRNMVALPVDEH